MFCDSDVLCFFVRNLLVSNLTETHHWLIFCTGNGGYVPTFELAEWEWWTRSKHFKTICPKVGVHTNCISSVVPVVSHRAPPRMPFIPNVTMGGKTHPQRVGWLLGVSHEFGVDTAQGRLVNTAEGQTHSFRIRIVIKVGPNEYVADAGCDSMTSKKHILLHWWTPTFGPPLPFCANHRRFRSWRSRTFNVPQHQLANLREAEFVLICKRWVAASLTLQWRFHWGEVVKYSTQDHNTTAWWFAMWQPLKQTILLVNYLFLAAIASCL